MRWWWWSALQHITAYHNTSHSISQHIRRDPHHSISQHIISQHIISQHIKYPNDRHNISDHPHHRHNISDIRITDTTSQHIITHSISSQHTTHHHNTSVCMCHLKGMGFIAELPTRVHKTHLVIRMIDVEYKYCALVIWLYCAWDLILLCCAMIVLLYDSFDMCMYIFVANFMCGCMLMYVYVRMYVCYMYVVYDLESPIFAV